MRTPPNSSQSRVWLARFPANLSLLFQSKCGGQSRKLYKKLQATPQVRLSREDKGKMPAWFVETISHEAKTATIPSPNLGAVTPRSNLVLMSEATDGVANTTPVP